MPPTPPDILAHLAGRAKPPGSLGRLEAVAARLCAVQRTVAPVTRPRRLVVFAADHGVTAEGVSAWPPAVTAAVADLIAAGRAGSAVLADAVRCDYLVVDVGVAAPPQPDGPRRRHRRVRDGSRNLAHEPALTAAEFRAAVAVGRELASDAVSAGVAVLAAGDVGIGNTTPAACLTALLCDLPADAAVGPGAGGTADTLERKTRVCREACDRYRPLRDDPEQLAAAVGGLEIAAIAGFYAAAAAAGTTVVVDGFVATAAALVADRLWPGTAAALIAAHRSAEPGHAFALRRLGLEPVLDGWGLRLGEGTGALLAMPLLDAAAAVPRMASLAEATGSGAGDQGA